MVLVSCVLKMLLRLVIALGPLWNFVLTRYYVIGTDWDPVDAISFKKLRLKVSHGIRKGQGTWKSKHLLYAEF